MPKSGVRYRVLDFLNLPKYRVGTDGSVWSRHNNRWGLGSWKQLKPLVNPRHGTVSVCLRVDRKGVFWKVARLVLEAFVGPCPVGMEACHFPDRDQTNNRLENLRWDTHESNEHDKKVHGTWEESHGTEHMREMALSREEYSHSEETKAKLRAAWVRRKASGKSLGGRKSSVS